MKNARDLAASPADSKLTVMKASLKSRGSRSRIRLALDQPWPEHLVVKIATTQEELTGAFTLLHDAYVDTGIMRPHRAGMRLNIYQALPTTTTIVAKIDGEVLGTMSAIVDSPLGLPIDKAFDLTRARAASSRLVEISGLAVHPRFRRYHGAVLFALVKYLYLYSELWLHADRLVISVHPRHEEFYENILLFDRLQKEIVSDYEFANHLPAVGFTTDLKRYRTQFSEVYSGRPSGQDVFRFLFERGHSELYFPDRPLFLGADPVMSPDLLRYFFLDRSDLLRSLSPKELQHIFNAYHLPEFEPLFRELGSGRNQSFQRPQRFSVCLPVANDQRMTIFSLSRGGFAARLESSTPTTGQIVHWPLRSDLWIDGLIQPRWQLGSHQGFTLRSRTTDWDQLVNLVESHFREPWKSQIQPAKVA